MDEQQMKSDTEEIVRQFCIIVEQEQLQGKCLIQPRREVRVMLRIVKEHCNTDDTVKNLTVNLIDFLSGEDQEKARRVFNDVVDGVFFQSSEECNVSWGRIVAIFVFCYNIIELLIKKNKRFCTPSVHLWFENFLCEKLYMINPQGNGKDYWKDFLNFTSNLEESGNNSLFLFNFVLLFTTVSILYFCIRYW